MTEAIFTLVGVLFGAAIPIWLERRRVSRDEARSQQQEGRELRRAARLVLEELGNRASEVEEAIANGHWWPAERQLSTAEWNKWREPLALLLDDSEAWDEIQLAFRDFDRLNWQHREERTAADSPSRPRIEDMLTFTNAYSQAESAMEVLFHMLDIPSSRLPANTKLA